MVYKIPPGGDVNHIWPLAYNTLSNVIRVQKIFDNGLHRHTEQNMRIRFWFPDHFYVINFYLHSLVF